MGISKMIFKDDEPILTFPDSGPRPPPFLLGRVQLTCKNNDFVPLEESKFQVILELSGTSDRPGLDLVVVLDVSDNMQEEELAKLKIALLFVIKKLSSIDRLSIVAFNDHATRLCPLMKITETSQNYLQYLISGLANSGETNITDGLEIGLKVLNDRKITGGRMVAIMLMSGSEQTCGGDAAQVPVGSVPVHTFGFGVNYDPRVLMAIATNSCGGTFSDVQNTDNLSQAFSMCLGGLLTVVVQDLYLTVTSFEDESTIDQVYAIGYPPQTKDVSAGSITVNFGDLYSKELFTVIVDLLLPKVSEKHGADVLEISFSYRIQGKVFDSSPVILAVRREQEERPEFIAEETHLQIAKTMKETRVMSDSNNLEDARDKLAEAAYLLEDVLQDDNGIVENLKEQMLKLIKAREKTRSLSENLRLFLTPDMEKSFEQTKKFAESPSQTPPTVDGDTQALSFYIQGAIQALQSIDKMIK